jgi:hypothetical protein
MRPASLRPQAKFIGKAAKVGGKKLEIDWERIDDSYNHRFNMDLNNRQLAQLRQELIEAEALHRPKARKIRRKINSLLEQNLAIHCTWCNGCMNYLHNCKCEGIEKGAVRRLRKNENARLARQRVRNDRIIAKFRATYGIQG